MRRYVLPALTVLAVFVFSSWSIGQDVDEAACQQTIQTSCTKCHSTERICNELDDANADWPEIVKEMGKRGKLSQEIQDTVLKCLTESAEPKKLVCTK